MQTRTRKLALVVASFGVVAIAFTAQAQFTAPTCVPPNCSPAVIQNISLAGITQNAGINISGDAKLGATLQTGAAAPVLALATDNLMYGNVGATSVNGSLLLLQFGAADRLRVSLTGQLQLPLGTAAAPSYTFLGDTNNGIYSPAADQIGFTTGGAQKLLLNSSGTTVSSGQLIVPVGTAALPSITFAGDTNTGIYHGAADTINLATNGASRLQIDSTGFITVPGSLGVLGTFSAAAFAGDGGGLTNLNAANLTNGPVPSSVISGTYSNAVTFSNAGNSFTGSGAGLTGISATNITTGTLPDAQLSANIARLNAIQTFTAANTFSSASNAFTGVGTNLTALNGTNITSGTVADTRLSANIPKLNQNNTFTANTVISADLRLGAYTLVNAVGQNVLWDQISAASTGGNFLLFEKGAGVPKFTVDYNGNTTIAGNLTVTGTVTGAFTEADTLNTVTGRGNTTPNSIVVGGGGNRGVDAQGSQYGVFGTSAYAGGTGVYGWGISYGVNGGSTNGYGGFFSSNTSNGVYATSNGAAAVQAVGTTALNAVGMSTFGGASTDLAANQNLIYGVINNQTGGNANMLKLEYPAGTNVFSVDPSGQVIAAAQITSTSPYGYEGFVSTDGGNNFLQMNEAQMNLVHFGISEWLLDSNGRSWQAGNATFNGGLTVGPNYYFKLQPTTLAALGAGPATDGVMYYDSGTNKFMCRAAGVWSLCSGGGISGTANYVARFATASTLGNSVIQDNGSTVGVGTSPAATALLVAGPTALSNAFTATTNANNGVGVYGFGMGTTAIGVYGQGTGAGTVGVGTAAGTGVGVQGSGQFAGVTGAGTGGSGSVGVQGSGPNGVKGIASDVWGYGVQGIASANSWVYGVYGNSSSNQFNSAGVAGTGNNNAMGGYFQANTAGIYALLAYNGAGGNAFQAQGNSNFTGAVTMNSTLAIGGTFRLGNLASAPAGATGMMYYDTVAGKMKCYEGGWVNCVSAGGVEVDTLATVTGRGATTATPISVTSGATAISGSGSGAGVYGTAASNGGIGVQGVMTTTGGYGVYGNSSGSGGNGVYGQANASNAIGVNGLGGYIGVAGAGPYGVYGDGGSSGTYAAGVYGTGYHGVEGFAKNNGYGLYGTGYYGALGSGSYIGLYGIGGTYALYTSGNSYINGSETVTGDLVANGNSWGTIDTDAYGGGSWHYCHAGAVSSPYQANYCSCNNGFFVAQFWASSSAGYFAVLCTKP